MKIKTVMTPCPYTIEHDTQLEKALEKMRLYNIRHLPVIKAKDLIGVVSEREIALGILLSKSVGFPPTVGEICQSDPFVVSQDEDLSTVLHDMAEQKHNYALITDDDLRFIGIFTTIDACRVAHMLLEEHFRSDEADDADES